jgi:hypothetical protein
VILAGLLLLLAGCYSGDYAFHVRNDTGETWWLRVAIGGQWPEDAFWVAQVNPGADGFAFDWYGPSDKPVELLTGECEVIGVFAADANGTFRIDAVPGITGTVTPIGRSLPEPRPSDGGLIIADGRCNGTMLS